MAQSTNDVIPSAGKLTVLDLLPDLLHALESLHAALLDKSQEFDHILKMGRTQLEDAVPMRLGQSFHAYATMIERDIRRIERARKELFTLNLGGTAIGTTINASDYYLHHIVPTLAAVTGYPLMQADDLFDATENLDGFVTISNTLRPAPSTSPRCATTCACCPADREPDSARSTCRRCRTDPRLCRARSTRLSRRL